MELKSPTIIVIPTYCEINNLTELTNRVLHAVPKIHILFVDDASPDGTAQWIKQHSLYGTQFFLIERQGKMGLGTAYLDGFRWALERNYELILEMDADLSHDPSAIPSLIREIEKGADLVLASRYIGGVRVLNWPIGRLLLSIGAGVYVRVITGMPFTDPTGGYKCFHRRVLEAIPFNKIRSNGYAFQIEMTFWAWRLGFRIVEVPIVFEERAEGMSKMSSGIAREAIWEVLRLGLFGKFLGIPNNKK